MKTRLTSLFAALAMALAFAAPAMAQTDSPNADVYEGVAGQEDVGGGGGNVAGAEEQGAAPAAAPAQQAADTDSTLPFTGAELGLFALVGGLLLGTGLVMRRAAGSSDRA